MLHNKGNIVLVGGGGAGMSALALLFDTLGYDNIVAIDKYQSEITDKLRAQGIHMIIGHGQYEVKREDYVIYSDIQAIKEGPEVSKSFTLKQDNDNKHFHRPFTYSEFLGEISKRFKTVSFAGSNGKSSITGLAVYAASQLFNDFGLGILGSFMPDFGQQNYVLNHDARDDIRSLFDHIFTAKNTTDMSLLKKYWFFVEACEFKDHFLHYDNDFSVITNIAHDHVDYFPTMESYVASFEKLIIHTKQTAFVSQQAYDVLAKYVAMGELEDRIQLSKQLPQKVPFTTLFGAHHQWNADQIATLFQAIDSDCKTTMISNALKDFKGLRRRMELLYTSTHGGVLYTDYSHHAPAIAANIQALREQFPNHKLTAIFQPHQARRVVEGWHDFAQALRQFDTCIIYELYTAREKIQDFDFSKVTNHTIDSFERLGQVFAQECQGSYSTDIEPILHMIEHAKKNEIFVIFAAGNLDYVVRKRVAELG